MASWNIYAGNKEEKQQMDNNLSTVSELLDLDTYKGASSSALIRWLGKQNPAAVAKALQSLREIELKNKIDMIRKEGESD